MGGCNQIRKINNQELISILKNSRAILSEHTGLQLVTVLYASENPEDYKVRFHYEYPHEDLDYWELTREELETCTAVWNEYYDEIVISDIQGIMEIEPFTPLCVNKPRYCKLEPLKE